MTGFNQIVPESSFCQDLQCKRTAIFFYLHEMRNKHQYPIYRQWVAPHKYKKNTFQKDDSMWKLELLGANHFLAGRQQQKTQRADPSTENMGAMIKVINHDNFIPTTVVESWSEMTEWQNAFLVWEYKDLIRLYYIYHNWKTILNILYWKQSRNVSSACEYINIIFVSSYYVLV